MDEQQPPPYGDGVTQPIHPIDAAALEAAANRFENWLAFAAVNQPGVDHIRQVSYADYPIGAADLKILLVDYRHHRPTQWAYDRTCEALHAQRERAEKAEAEVTRLADELDAAQSSGDRAASREHELLNENAQLKADTERPRSADLGHAAVNVEVAAADGVHYYAGIAKIHASGLDIWPDEANLEPDVLRVGPQTEIRFLTDQQINEIACDADEYAANQKER